MIAEEDGTLHPKVLPFTEAAQELLNSFRHEIRTLEASAEGILHSFIGKMSGLAVRLATLLSFLDYASGEEEEPVVIGLDAIGRALTFLRDYALPMAQRTFADDALPKSEKAARRLLSLLIKRGESQFSARDIQRQQVKGLTRKAELDPALRLLLEGCLIRAITIPPGASGGAPKVIYLINPVVFQRGQRQSKDS